MQMPIQLLIAFEQLNDKQVWASKSSDNPFHSWNVKEDGHTHFSVSDIQL